MIKIPIEYLEKYEKDYLKALQAHLLKKIIAFPTPYALNSDTEKEDFVQDLLCNPFESDILFLKEYYLTMNLIASAHEMIKNKKTVWISKLLDEYQLQLDSNSIFKKIIVSYKKQSNLNICFECIISLLHQFISNKKDANNSSKKPCQHMERLLQNLIPTEYSEYQNVRDFLIYIRNQYDSDKFKKIRVGIIKAINIKVCPYCNRQYIDTFKRRAYKDEIAIAQLDHFYPRADFPLYAITLYNFVPSCAKCNSLKSNNLSAYLYPYSKAATADNQYQYFNLEFADYDTLHGVGDKQPKIKLSNLDSATLKNAEALYHEELYKNHADFAQELLRAQRLDNDVYRSSINQYFTDYQLTENDLKKLIYGFDGSKDEVFNKPLAKLAHDIIKFPHK